MRQAGEWVGVLAATVVVALLLKTFVVQLFYIPSASMEHTLLVNDRVLVNKLSYRLHEVRRGDIVVFEHQAVEDGTVVKDVIKRVVALPGERVHIDERKVFVNGEELAEPYLEPGMETFVAPREQAFQGRQCTRAEPCSVPSDAVWVMGDNRVNSQDSRYIGPVRLDEIVGRTFVVVWPPTRLGGL